MRGSSFPAGMIPVGKAGIAANAAGTLRLSFSPRRPGMSVRSGTRERSYGLSANTFTSRGVTKTVLPIEMPSERWRSCVSSA